jgi:hypothetical protein
MRSHDNLRAAIGLMTAWNDDAASQLVQVQQLDAIEDPTELVGLVEGLASLAGILLTKRRAEAGVSESQTLLELALQYANV